jgi:hypothetical protein
MSIRQQINSLQAELFTTQDKEEKLLIENKIEKLKNMLWEQDQYFVNIDEQYQVN